MRILFLCTGNSCRSQMAEGWAKHLHGAEHTFESAGIVAHGQNPNALKVMAEVGVDISDQASTSLDQFDDLTFDVVFTVCGHADESCPIFPGNTIKVHSGFDDPPKLAANANSEEEALDHYRRVRNDIKNWIEQLPQQLSELVEK